MSGRGLRIALVGDGVTKHANGGISGANLYLVNCAKALIKKGYSVKALVTEGTLLPGALETIGIKGNLQASLLHHEGPDFYPINADNVIANYCEYLRARQHEYDVIINFCHDWLPIYLTPFFHIPMMHIPNLANLNEVVSHQLNSTAELYPEYVSVISDAQRHSIGLPESIYNLRASVDMSEYEMGVTPLADREYLAFAGRMSPEKGLEDAAEIAKRAGLKLHVFGAMEKPDYYAGIMERYAGTIVYKGFLDRHGLAEQLRGAKAQICTHKCVEAFGMVVIEALACGTPVIAYDRGAPQEAIEHGRTGFVVPMDDIAAAAGYVAQLSSLKPQDCRLACEKTFSLDVMGERLDDWVHTALRRHEADRKAG